MGGDDADVVFALPYFSAHFAQFRGHGGQAIGFFDASVVYVANAGGAFCEQCGGGDGHGGVGNMVEVHINAAQFSFTNNGATIKSAVRY